MAERTRVPGISRGRRYRAEAGSPRYFALYQADAMVVLTPGAYRAQLDTPTDWTRRVTARLTFARRGLCDVAASAGDGEGGVLAVVHLKPVDAVRLRGWIAGTLLPGLTEMRDVACAHLWTLSPGEVVSPTTQISQNAGGGDQIAWIIVVEAMDLAAADAAVTEILARDPAAHGAADVTIYPRYRLLYARDGRSIVGG